MCRYWIWMWELDYKEGWALKNWCFRTMVLKKTLESPLDSKEIKPVNPKGNQPWIFIGRTDAKALKFCWLMQRADSLEKTLLLGKIESKRRKRWQRMRWLVSITNSIDVNVRELQEIDSEGQRSLAGFSPGVTKSRTGLNIWITTGSVCKLFSCDELWFLKKWKWLSRASVSLLSCLLKVTWVLSQFLLFCFPSSEQWAVKLASGWAV